MRSIDHVVASIAALVLVCALTALALPRAMAQAPGDKELVAVMDLRGVGASEPEAAALTNRLREVLLNTGRVTLVDRSQMDAVLGEQALQQTGCTSQECVVQVGQVLGVRKIVTGELVKVSDRIWMLSTLLIDVETTETLRVASVRHSGDYFSLLDERVNELGDKLVGSSAVALREPAPQAAMRRPELAAPPIGRESPQAARRPPKTTEPSAHAIAQAPPRTAPSVPSTKPAAAQAAAVPKPETTRLPAASPDATILPPESQVTRPSDAKAEPTAPRAMGSEQEGGAAAHAELKTAVAALPDIPSRASAVRAPERPSEPIATTRQADATKQQPAAMPSAQAAETTPSLSVAASAAEPAAPQDRAKLPEPALPAPPPAAAVVAAAPAPPDTGAVRTPGQILAGSLVELRIRSEPPGARIYLDGRRFESLTPHETTGYYTGDHQVLLKKVGYRAEVREVVGKAGASVEIHVALQPIRGAAIDLTEAPPNLAATLDGQPAGTTPLSIDGLQPGSHRLELRAPGYKPWSGAVVLRPDEEQAVKPDLQRVRVAMFPPLLPIGDTRRERRMAVNALQNALSSTVPFQLAYTPYRELVAGSGARVFAEDADVYASTWTGFLFKEPDAEFVLRKAKALGVDGVLTFDVSGGVLSSGSITVYLYDVASGQEAQTKRSWPRGMAETSISIAVIDALKEFAQRFK